MFLMLLLMHIKQPEDGRDGLRVIDLFLNIKDKNM